VWYGAQYTHGGEVGCSTFWTFRSGSGETASGATPAKPNDHQTGKATFKILGEKLRSYIKVPHSIAPKIKMKVLEAPGEGYFFYLELFRSGGVKAKKNP
jgi:hypothetical protein